MHGENVLETECRGEGAQDQTFGDCHRLGTGKRQRSSEGRVEEMQEREISETLRGES